MSFDTSVLSRPLTDGERVALRDRQRRGAYGRGLRPVAAGVFFVAVLWLVSLPLVSVVLNRLANRDTAAWVALGVFAVAAAIGVVLAVLMWRSSVAGRGLVIPAFAEANHLVFRYRTPSPGYPGVLFGVGRQRQSVNHVTATQGTFAEAGQYQFATGSPLSWRYRFRQRWNVWSYAAFTVPADLPHVVVDARANNSWWSPDMPVEFPGSSEVPLTPPDDQHYRLIVQRGYEREALSIVTPALVAQLVAAPVTLDVEIVQGWLFCYTKDRVDFTNPATWRAIDAITSMVEQRWGPALVERATPDQTALRSASAGGHGGDHGGAQTRERRGGDSVAGMVALVFVATVASIVPVVLAGRVLGWW